MKFGKPRPPDPHVDLTAAIDVVFNLLLFFMVTTSFDHAQPGMQVDLPRSSAQAVISADKDLNVWMTVDGSVYVDEVAVDTAGLRAAFTDRARANPKTLVVIKADRGVTHGRVVAVMDMARAVGLKLAIATDPEADEAR